MELDDLRRQWQQPEPSAAALSATQLREMLARQRDNLADKMRRNARWEMALAVLMAGLMLGGFILLHKAVYRLYTGFSLLLMLVLVYYYYRLLAMLRQMDEPSSSVRRHLVQLCAGLRQMLRFNYKLTLWVLPWTLILIYGFFTGQLLAGKAKYSWQIWALAGGILLVLGAVVQVGVVYFTRWYMQRLYGQHLDRLEGQLHELDEGTGPGVAESR
ncbi:hypothetical protein FNT36_18985 [Hymenobacter setariae]|uniref:Uncharacterized protein n=1 Tax=Hymenobacter setariae TaxID=2594794 RepID=A0A558BP43_9BACT|nr:hypothetical protein [Hymenobacter setariae]TVT38286.1 hypothetical protein FNT36_18985 [Hymenobacter setariae]